MTSVLITGANKGIGRGFVENYLARPDITVVAAARNPAGKDAQELLTLPTGKGSKLILVKIESTSDTDAVKAVETIKAQGVSHLDLVIANAGIFKSEAFKDVAVMKTADLLEHVDVNTGGPVRLFQAVLPLLKAAKQPKFVVISTIVASIGNADQIPWNITAYGASKAAVNFLLRRIHIENPDLVALAIHPGAVQTDEGNKAAQCFGFENAFVSVVDSVNAGVAKIDAATREETSGKFLSFDDTPMVW